MSKAGNQGSEYRGPREGEAELGRRLRLFQLQKLGCDAAAGLSLFAARSSVELARCSSASPANGGRTGRSRGITIQPQKSATKVWGRFQAQARFGGSDWGREEVFGAGGGQFSALSTSVMRWPCRKPHAQGTFRLTWLIRRLPAFFWCPRASEGRLRLFRAAGAVT